LDYLREFEANKPTFFKKQALVPFSNPKDQAGYSDKSITSDMITDIFLEFSERTRKQESHNYLQVLTGAYLSPIWQTANTHQNLKAAACHSTTLSSVQRRPLLLITQLQAGGVGKIS
jgi:hypothetical protein